MTTETVSKTELGESAFNASEMKLWELHVMLQEALAVVQCRLEHLGSEVAYGARDLLKACAGRIRKAIEEKSGDGIENESAPLGVAFAVLHVAADQVDDQVMWAAVRIVKSVKEKLDELILHLPIEA